ncbi:MAG: Asp-tRNA(Asn)/Glu-tRNA(Gln) amidotransferase subunit GatA [Candidatus Yanofskybacteria bacterium]|nr:Asp-tRNA(Asn)/Glu-tRNA(Gln) amidotransferase subunit GatA [Candidatus Yanofskybacteria bacterium]
MTSIRNTIKSVNDGLKKGEFSVEEIVAEYHKQIAKENPKLNAYLSVFNKPKLETRNQELETNFLSGVPCAVKDNILISGEKCTAASKILKNYIAPYDATVISNLKQAGAVFLGKTNLDEFAMGATGENSAFGPTLNPHDHTRVAGGSSAGSAAAVASNLAVYALGSDTGGSIRAPASWCGAVGLKPTYGLVSRHGLIAMASSLDQIGPITKTVEDAAIVLNAIAGHDPMDSTSVNPEWDLPDYTANLNKPIAGLKVAVPKDFFSVPSGSASVATSAKEAALAKEGRGLDSQVNNLAQAAIAKLESLGAHIDQVSLPMVEYAIATYYIIVSSEISANLARYDGIRYGYSTSKAENLLETYLKSRAEGFGAEVKRRVMLGTYALSAGYYDAYYLKAQKVRSLIKRDFEKVFEKYDVIVGPTMPYIAPKLGGLSDPLSAYLADIYTAPVNLAGLPAISIPCGFIEPETSNQKLVTRLPVGFQIIGKHFDEAKILQVAHNLEQSGK